MRVAPVARQRRHTLHFLDEIRGFAPVFIDTEVDMSAIRAYRAAGPRYSTVTHVLHAAARVLAAHPGANAAIRGRVRPRVARYETVNGKLALDKRLGGERVVLAGVLTGLESAGLDEIQGRVDRLRDG